MRRRAYAGARALAAASRGGRGASTWTGRRIYGGGSRVRARGGRFAGAGASERETAGEHTCERMSGAFARQGAGCPSVFRRSGLTPTPHACAHSLWYVVYTISRESE